MTRRYTKRPAAALVALLSGLWCFEGCYGEPFVNFAQELENDAGRDNNERSDSQYGTLVIGPDGNDAMGETYPIDVVWVDVPTEAGETGVDTGTDSESSDGDDSACAVGTTIYQCGPQCPNGYSTIEYCWGTQCGMNCGNEAKLTCVCKG